VADADREDEGAAPLDEDAAWAALVAGYDAEPEPGTEPSWPESENVPADADTATAPPAPPAPPPSRTIVVHPVISGPRNYELVDDEEDAHFIPPEPPPLPESDLTTKFAWIGVIGGPLLLLGFVLFQLELTWWAMVLGGGGFLGGFATLFARMRTDEDDDDLPGGGAVV
jgi:hypothetical protein